MTDLTENENHPAWKCPSYKFPFGLVPFASLTDDPATGRFLHLEGKGYEMPRNWIMNRINPLTLETEVYVGPWYSDKEKYAEGYWVELEMLKAVVDL